MQIKQRKDCRGCPFVYLIERTINFHSFTEVRCDIGEAGLLPARVLGCYDLTNFEGYIIPQLVKMTSDHTVELEYLNKFMEFQNNEYNVYNQLPYK